ncbi:MAG: hypothetical protein PUB39_01230 [Eubacteriales bacterium]|nr:hypothetical protein [Eubacteriales bacterium]
MGIKDAKAKVFKDDRRREREVQEKLKREKAEERKNFVPETPDMYIGTPDMLDEKTRKRLRIVSFAREAMLQVFFAFLILTLGCMAVVGVINIFYDKYLLGDIYEAAVKNIYRPTVYTGLIAGIALMLICGIIITQLYIDRKRMCETAFDMLREKGIKPPYPLKKDGQQEKFLVRFYNLKVPYKPLKLLSILALVVLVITGVRFNGQAQKQKVETARLRKEAVSRIVKAYTTDDFTPKYSGTKISFVERYIFLIGPNAELQLDIDDNGEILDSATMVRYAMRFSNDEMKKLSAADIEKLANSYQKPISDIADLFPTKDVAKVKFDFSDYMNSYINTVREKSKWNKTVTTKAGKKTFYVIQELKNTGTDAKDGGYLTVKLTLKQKGFDKAAEAEIARQKKKAESGAGRYSIQNWF